MRITVLVLLLVAPTSANVSAQSVAESFAPLVGTWETEDTYHPVDGPPLVETGVRTCSLVLRDQYLQCDSEAINAEGTERSYRWMINYNRVLDRFEMLSIWSNVPFKSVSELEALEDHRGWRISSIALVGDNGEFSPTYSEMVVETRSRIVWTGRRVTAGQPIEDAPISFVETWVRH